MPSHQSRQVVSSGICQAGTTKAAALPCPTAMLPLLVSRLPPGWKKGAFEPLQSCSGELVWWLLLGGWMWNKLGCAFGMEWWLVSCCSALDWPACEGLGGWASPPEGSLSGSLRPRKGIGMFSTANTCFPWSGQAYLSIPWAQQTLRVASGWCEPVVCSNKLSVTESF